MTYKVRLVPSAARQLRKFDPDAKRRIQAAIELLAVEPRPPTATRLVGGSGEWRVRTGNYRIVYEIEDNELVVLGLRVGHRREVHRRSIILCRSSCVDHPGRPTPSLESRRRSVRFHPRAWTAEVKIHG